MLGTVRACRNKETAISPAAIVLPLPETPNRPAVLLTSVQLHSYNTKRGCQGQMTTPERSGFLRFSSGLTGAVMIDRIWAGWINHRHTEAAPCATGRRGARGVEGHASRSAWLSRADARSRSERMSKVQ